MEEKVIQQYTKLMLDIDGLERLINHEKTIDENRFDLLPEHYDLAKNLIGISKKIYSSVINGDINSLQSIRNEIGEPLRGYIEPALKVWEKKINKVWEYKEKKFNETFYGVDKEKASNLIENVSKGLTALTPEEVKTVEKGLEAFPELLTAFKEKVELNDKRYDLRLHNTILASSMKLPTKIEEDIPKTLAEIDTISDYTEKMSRYEDLYRDLVVKKIQDNINQKKDAILKPSEVDLFWKIIRGKTRVETEDKKILFKYTEDDYKKAIESLIRPEEQIEEPVIGIPDISEFLKQTEIKEPSDATKIFIEEFTDEKYRLNVRIPADGLKARAKYLWNTVKQSSVALTPFSQTHPIENEIIEAVHGLTPAETFVYKTAGILTGILVDLKMLSALKIPQVGTLDVNKTFSLLEKSKIDFDFKTARYIAKTVELGSRLFTTKLALNTARILEATTNNLYDKREKEVAIKEIIKQFPMDFAIDLLCGAVYSLNTPSLKIGGKVYTSYIPQLALEDAITFLGTYYMTNDYETALRSTIINTVVSLPQYKTKIKGDVRNLAEYLVRKNLIQKGVDERDADEIVKYTGEIISRVKDITLQLSDVSSKYFSILEQISNKKVKNAGKLDTPEIKRLQEDLQKASIEMYQKINALGIDEKVASVIYERIKNINPNIKEDVKEFYKNEINEAIFNSLELWKRIEANITDIRRVIEAKHFKNFNEYVDKVLKEYNLFYQRIRGTEPLEIGEVLEDNGELYLIPHIRYGKNYTQLSDNELANLGLKRLKEAMQVVGKKAGIEVPVPKEGEEAPKIAEEAEFLSFKLRAPSVDDKVVISRKDFGFIKDLENPEPLGKYLIYKKKSGYFVLFAGDKLRGYHLQLDTSVDDPTSYYRAIKTVLGLEAQSRGLVEKADIPWDVNRIQSVNFNLLKDLNAIREASEILREKKKSISVEVKLPAQITEDIINKIGIQSYYRAFFPFIGNALVTSKINDVEVVNITRHPDLDGKPLTIFEIEKEKFTKDFVDEYVKSWRFPLFQDAGDKVIGVIYGTDIDNIKGAKILKKTTNFLADYTEILSKYVAPDLPFDRRYADDIISMHAHKLGMVVYPTTPEAEIVRASKIEEKLIEDIIERFKIGEPKYAPAEEGYAKYSEEFLKTITELTKSEREELARRLPTRPVAVAKGFEREADIIYVNNKPILTPSRFFVLLSDVIQKKGAEGNEVTITKEDIPYLGSFKLNLKIVSEIPDKIEGDGIVFKVGDEFVYRLKNPALTYKRYADNIEPQWYTDNVLNLEFSRLNALQFDLANREAYRRIYEELDGDKKENTLYALSITGLLPFGGSSVGLGLTGKLLGDILQLSINPRSVIAKESTKLPKLVFELSSSKLDDFDTRVARVRAIPERPFSMADPNDTQNASRIEALYRANKKWLDTVSQIPENIDKLKKIFNAVYGINDITLDELKRIPAEALQITFAYLRQTTYNTDAGKIVMGDPIGLLYVLENYNNPLIWNDSKLRTGWLLLQASSPVSLNMLRHALYTEQNYIDLNVRIEDELIRSTISPKLKEIKRKYGFDIHLPYSKQVVMWERLLSIFKFKTGQNRNEFEPIGSPSEWASKVIELKIEPLALVSFRRLGFIPDDYLNALPEKYKGYIKEYADLTKSIFNYMRNLAIQFGYPASILGDENYYHRYYPEILKYYLRNLREVRPNYLIPFESVVSGEIENVLSPSQSFTRYAKTFIGFDLDPFSAFMHYKEMLTRAIAFSDTPAIFKIFYSKALSELKGSDIDAFKTLSSIKTSLFNAINTITTGQDVTTRGALKVFNIPLAFRNLRYGMLLGLSLRPVFKNMFQSFLYEAWYDIPTLVKARAKAILNAMTYLVTGDPTLIGLTKDEARFLLAGSPSQDIKAYMTTRTQASKLMESIILNSKGILPNLFEATGTRDIIGLQKVAHNILLKFYDFGTKTLTVLNRLQEHFPNFRLWSAVDIYNRLVGWYASEEYGKKLGLSRKETLNLASEIIRQTQFLYSMSGMPLAYYTPTTGALYRMSMFLKFPISMLGENWGSAVAKKNVMGMLGGLAFSYALKEVLERIIKGDMGFLVDAYTVVGGLRKGALQMIKSFGSISGVTWNLISDLYKVITAKDNIGSVLERNYRKMLRNIINISAYLPLIEYLTSKDKFTFYSKYMYDVDLWDVIVNVFTPADAIRKPNRLLEITKAIYKEHNKAKERAQQNIARIYSLQTKLALAKDEKEANKIREEIANLFFDTVKGFELFLSDKKVLKYFRGEAKGMEGIMIGRPEFILLAREDLFKSKEAYETFRKIIALKMAVEYIKRVGGEIPNQSGDILDVLPYVNKASKLYYMLMLLERNQKKFFLENLKEIQDDLRDKLEEDIRGIDDSFEMLDDELKEELRGEAKILKDYYSTGNIERYFANRIIDLGNAYFEGVFDDLDFERQVEVIKNA